jgi:hypothetical protein
VTFAGCFEDTQLPPGITDTVGSGDDVSESNGDGDGDEAGDGDESGDGDGDTAGDGDGDSVGDGDGDGDGDPEADCETYCDFQAVCDDDFPQYGSSGPCLSVCAQMPLGSTGDQTGNTVGCRTFYAIEAGENTAQKEQFCLNSGPSGNDACGGRCESFCAIAQQACTGDQLVYADTVECLTACAEWDDSVTYSANTVEANNYACRLKHLTYATLNPTTHCSHIAPESPVCVDP